MRVLLTGSRGHVGRAIVKQLTAEGHTVFGVNRSPDENKRLEKQYSLDLGTDSLRQKLVKAIPPCEVIIHAAAAIDRNFFDQKIVQTNAVGTHRILMLAQRWQVHSFIYLSSIYVIGRPVQQPITEQHPTDPQTVYHASKLFGEHLTGIAIKEGLRGTILRISSPVGPGMPHDNRILPAFVKRAIANEPLIVRGRGTRHQNYVDVRDISKAVSRCIEKQPVGRFNIGSKYCISNFQLAETCLRTLNSTSEIHFSDKSDEEEGFRWEVSIAKAGQGFGYEPNYLIEDAIYSLAAEFAEAQSQRS